MSAFPWISIVASKEKSTLWAQENLFTSISSKGPSVRPSVITLVGAGRKGLLLSHLLEKPNDSDIYASHGKVRLILDPKSTRHDAPIIYVDCELQSDRRPSQRAPMTSWTQHEVMWSEENDPPAQLPNIFVSNVLRPLSNVVCYFASDLHGIQGVSNLLAYQAIRSGAQNLPRSARAHILVVMDTTSNLFDPLIAQQKLHASIKQAMTKYKDYIDTNDTDDDLRANFHSIQVLGLQKSWDHCVSSIVLRRRINSLAQEVYWGRRTSRRLFTVAHIDALADRMLARFCLDKSSINFLRVSRPNQFAYKDLHTHLGELFRLMPSQSWLWRFGIPLIASALFLASYPPGSHFFSASEIFEEFYAKRCKIAAQGYTSSIQVQQKILSDVKDEMGLMLSQLETNPWKRSAVHQHMERLSSLSPHFPVLKSFKSCLSCLMSMPDKVFDCGHSICDICIRRFGRRSRTEMHAFILPNCILCGHVQLESTYRLIPPTAGIRKLCIDGGGVRGIIPLTFLQHLGKELGHFGCALQEFFDYVCGTSSGGLIALGMFLMQWTPDECLSRFEDLAIKTFMAEPKEENLSWTQRLQRLLSAYFRDHRYDSSNIENAFCSTIGTSPKMFNPLRSDTKIAVTTTTVKGNIPCVFSNYNGGPRFDESIYRHIRADTCDDDISISDAAVCTSAAPFFFKPKRLINVGTFQDGGLQHNNPAFLASWECAVLWPDRCQILEKDKGRVDYMISLGTGTASSMDYEEGLLSPVRDRFPKRLFGNFNHLLDGQRQWRTFIRCVPPELRHRYHRLNVLFPRTEPALDEVVAIERLKHLTAHSITTSAQALVVKDHMIASIFYFELESYSRSEGDAYSCSGVILCRLPLDVSGRKKLYEMLSESSASFLVSGRPIPCVQSIPKGMPVFRRRIEFMAKKLDDEVDIAIEGVTQNARYISGMPRPLHQLVEALNLQAPFGCIDHREIEKPLPHGPLKRKLHQI